MTAQKWRMGAGERDYEGAEERFVGGIFTVVIVLMMLRAYVKTYHVAQLQCVKFFVSIIPQKALKISLKRLKKSC